ncbi:hypothetical protein [Burkholderia gladioli]|uniref:hypothetical protein n=1 Tax=Burkholderia gladioli TaxID=28095 RepID=UPI0034DB59FB
MAMPAAQQQHAEPDCTIERAGTHDGADQDRDQRGTDAAFETDCPGDRRRDERQQGENQKRQGTQQAGGGIAERQVGLNPVENGTKGRDRCAQIGANQDDADGEKIATAQCGRVDVSGFHDA